MELRMKHEVDSWVQATSPSHCEEESMPANLSPFTDSPPQSASTHAPLSRLQPIAVTAPEVRDEEACLMIGGAEDWRTPAGAEHILPRSFHFLQVTVCIPSTVMLAKTARRHI